jgi:hypothetical protein
VIRRDTLEIAQAKAKLVVADSLRNVAARGIATADSA